MNAEKTLEVLRSIEWAARDGYACPSCVGYIIDEHKPGCALAALIADVEAQIDGQARTREYAAAQLTQVEEMLARETEGDYAHRASLLRRRQELRRMLADAGGLGDGAGQEQGEGHDGHED